MSLKVFLPNHGKIHHIFHHQDNYNNLYSYYYNSYPTRFHRFHKCDRPNLKCKKCLNISLASTQVISNGKPSNTKYLQLTFNKRWTCLLIGLRAIKYCSFPSLGSIDARPSIKISWTELFSILQIFLYKLSYVS